MSSETWFALHLTSWMLLCYPCDHGKYPSRCSIPHHASTRSQPRSNALSLLHILIVIFFHFAVTAYVAVQDRQVEGSLLGGKQTRTEDSAQSENTAQSLNSHTWHNSSGTWTSPQENTHRTDEYGFPIRSEAPINAREFPSLAASKQAPSGKKTFQQDQVWHLFGLQ